MYPIRASLVCVGDTSMFEKQLALDNEEKKKHTKILIDQRNLWVPSGTRKTSRFFVVVFTFVLALQKNSDSNSRSGRKDSSTKGKSGD